jgi:phospholipid/cholesterol/gamma-HCH transport system permease protein
MTSRAHPPGALAGLASAAGRWVAGWWRVVHLGALLLALAFAPSSYGPENRRALARHAYHGIAPELLGFTVLTALVSLVLIRIVIVTAVSYGLSQYALEMVVRVLVLELIPLTAALFAALRCTIPHASALAEQRAQGRLDALRSEGVDPLRAQVLPRVVAGLFCALMLAAVSCVVTLVLAYLSVYGFTTSGFPAYTRTVGHVFDPSISLVFGLKIVFFGVAVALMPVAAVLDPAAPSRTSAELRGLVRMFVVILLIEAASLVGSYY